VLNHTNLFANFDRWAKDKTVYLAVLEEISNSQEAMSHLNVLDAFVTDKTAFENGTIAELLALGEKIRKTEYSSEYCQWCYEKPDEITAIEANATDILGVLVSGEKEKRNVLDDDLARELYAEETRLMAGRHVDKGLQCANWASLKVEYTESDIFVHSISEAQVGLSLLDSYEVEKKRFTATAVASLKELGQTVLARKYDTKYSNYVYENPDEIKTREADIDDYWAKLDQLSALRRTSLDMLLAREEKKEKMRIDFAGHAGDLMRYMEDKIEMIGSAEEQKIIFGFNLQEIESYDATLHTIDEDVGLTVSAKRNVCAGVVAEMKLLVNQTDEFDKAQAAKDEDPEEADEVSTDNTAVEFKRTRFNTLSKGIKKAFTRNKKKTSARDLFADQKAGDGDNDEPWPEEINPFTSITVHSIAEEADELFEATEMRRSNYDATLALWRENDAMCKTFSELVDPINTDVKSMVNDLIGAPGSDEEQLARVTVTLDTLIKHCFNIPAAQKQDGAIMARGISVNPYTTLSAEDMKCELENVQVIAEQKKPYLESLIEYKRFKGISREQYEEMETLFKEYDTDSSDSISGKELRACLFSLGEERTKTEIAGYVQQHGTNDTLKFSQFRDLMVTLIGDVGTQTGLTESFLLISRGVDFVEEKDLLELCKKPQVDYFKGEAETKETGFDFAPWISAVFSR